MTLLDLVGPTQVWSFLPDVQIQYVAPQDLRVATDCGLPVTATHSFGDAWEAPDVLFVGGGGKPALDAAADPRIQDFLRSRGERASWITSVCTGSLIMAAAGLYDGYRAATYWGAREMLAGYGIDVSEERVCIDRNRISGGGITAGIDFGLATAAHWFGDDTGRLFELVLEYAPQPPFGTGRPELADEKTLRTARTMTEAVFQQ
ncbi:DJ-1/PfpI family protein [Qipengyuania sp. 6D47A]|uniref:DJ-1/PfpI family protein n=2 Tax=Qipengyuania qiaonensis TaxID=2867240 RepID=A0ABS7J773_9SPHN|nr:DJ-1/PfpI family protein [Qipengyuania qiaonensis]